MTNKDHATLRATRPSRTNTPPTACITALDATREAIRLNSGYLRGVNLNGTDLSRIQLYETDLSSASFRAAYLGNANFRSANLSNVDMTAAKWEGADYHFATALGAAPQTFVGVAVMEGQNGSRCGMNQIAAVELK